MKDTINDRTNAYGGSMENRCKLLLEVTHAVINEIGAQKTAVRISPFSVYNAAGTDTNPEALLSYLLAELDKLNLAYIHLTEPEFACIVDNFIWVPQYGHLTKHRTTPLLGLYLSVGAIPANPGTKQYALRVRRSSGVRTILHSQP